MASQAGQYGHSIEKKRARSLNIAIAGVFLCMCLTCLVPRSMMREYFGPFNPPPVYEVETVTMICEQFEGIIADDDSFCAVPDNQNFQTLRLMLERYFPSGETTYDDIFPYFAGQGSVSWLDKTDGAYAGCLPPDSLNEPISYVCVFYYDDSSINSIDIRFDFDGSDSILREIRLMQPPEYYWKMEITGTPRVTLIP